MIYLIFQILWDCSYKKIKNKELFCCIYFNRKCVYIQDVGAFMSVLQDLVAVVISSQACHMNLSPIFSGYGAVDRNLR